ncbi:DUF3306 domain-containing protein [Plastorhodobacter daqingensis]|uniref:DUF3306 domain-containing protein n=1 Tax=Plastorhodobacter daqingensis TaxID=1387281 RepID=A0ABW2UQS7_9RHOB
MSGFLERWSQRKRKAGAVAEHAPPGPSADAELSVTDAQPASPATPEQHPPQEAVPEVEPAPLPDLPDIDSLTKDSDLTLFLQKGVPAALRNAAMRRMWALDPVISTHKDIAVDYAWDWNTPGGLPGSSGTISNDSVARVLRSLSGSEEEPQPKAVKADSDDAALPQAAGSADLQPLPATTVPDEAPAKGPAAATARSEDDVEEASRSRQMKTVSRRHGRARPE